MTHADWILLLGFIRWNYRMLLWSHVWHELTAHPRAALRLVNSFRAPNVRFEIPTPPVR